MFRFKLLSGVHAEEDKVHKAGTTFSSPHPLHEMFVNKFLLLKEATTGKKKPQNSKKDAIEPEEAIPSEETAPEEEVVGPSCYGDNVSERFPDAVSGGLMVFQSDDGYVVVDADEPDVSLNAVPFKTKKETQKFVEKNVKT